MSKNQDEWIPSDSVSASRSRLIALVVLSGILSGCSTVGFYHQAVLGHGKIMFGRERIEPLIEAGDTVSPLPEHGSSPTSQGLWLGGH
jgi:predicted aminopeptidase